MSRADSPNDADPQLAALRRELEQARAALAVALQQGDRVAAREIELRRVLGELRRQLNAAASRITDLELTLAQMAADQSTILKFATQKMREGGRVHGQIAARQIEIERLEGELIPLREKAEQLESLVHRLSTEASSNAQKVSDLLRSRWRKLGLRLGVARKAAWENGEADEHR